MKKVSILALLCAAVLTTSCGGMGALVGNYDKQYSIETTLPYDKVWDEVIDFFSSNAIPISTIEKSSGLIVSKGLAFDDSQITYEKQGDLANPYAFVVLEDYAMMPRQTDAVADFNVRVRQVEDKVKVTVNILNIKGKQLALHFLGLVSLDEEKVGKSTGVLETKLLEMFTKE